MNNPMQQLYGGQSQSPLAPTPTQTFKASNLLGTVTPVVGDSSGTQNYSGLTGGISQYHVVFVAVAFIAIGYLLFHLMFEE